MPEPNQSIEVRLARYIDGQLDQQQRHEIEQYLAQYPEHRKLIDELLRQRKLLGELPRESAPPDVLEHFQGRLERSALLDQAPANGAGGSMEKRRSFSFIGFAAVVLIAIALAIIIWIALPPQRPKPVAMDDFSAQPGIVPATEPATRASTQKTGIVTPPVTQPAVVARPVRASRTITYFLTSDDPAGRTNEFADFLARQGLSAQVEDLGGFNRQNPDAPVLVAAPSGKTVVVVVTGVRLEQVRRLIDSLSRLPAPGIIPAATNPTTIPATTPTTMPAQVATTAPSTRNTTTQPTANARLMIVIEPSAAAPATQPTSLPTSLPTTETTIVIPTT